MGMSFARDDVKSYVDVAKELRITLKQLDAMVHAGTFPQPDATIGTQKAWKARTVASWRGRQPKI
jgi:ketopantoate hydroxymethyltransferase